MTHEESAQAKYYALKDSSRPFIEPRLRSSTSSIESQCSTPMTSLSRSTSGGQINSSPCVKLRKWPKNKLSNSASASSLPRPKSYVPFQGCVETPPPPPGRAARDILHALSYAPISSTSPNLLRSKSSSFASLMCTQVPEDEKLEILNLNPVLYVQNEKEPVYAPTNPLNHPENRAVFMGHPPIIYPPPDLVPNLKSPSLCRTRSSTSSSGFETASTSSVSSFLNQCVQ